MDLAGPMNPTSSAGNKYVMVQVEHFTKHIEAVAIPALGGAGRSCGPAMAT